MKNVMLWAGAGQIGTAIARRMGVGMKIVVGDRRIENARAAAKTMNEAGFDVVPVEMDLSSRESIQALIAEGQFAAGSMLPKVKAAIAFAKGKKGRRAVIASLEKAPLAIRGESGTLITL